MSSKHVKKMYWLLNWVKACDGLKILSRKDKPTIFYITPCVKEYVNMPYRVFWISANTGCVRWSGEWNWE